MLSIGMHGSLPAVPSAVPCLILRSSIRDYRTWLRFTARAADNRQIEFALKYAF
jgi:hypothetical protein